MPTEREDVFLWENKRVSILRRLVENMRCVFLIEENVNAWPSEMFMRKCVSSSPEEFPPLSHRAIQIKLIAHEGQRLT